MKTEAQTTFEKCSNYAVLSTVVMNIVKSMSRFSKVPDTKIITDIYSRIKENAAKRK